MKPKSKQNPTETQLPKETEPSDFAFKITQTAVSQICQSVGFKSSQHSALETLTHIATLYLKTLAKISLSYSNQSSRTQSNVFDLINALHDIASEQGFIGASTIHNTCPLSSRVVKDLSVFVNCIDEVPFAKPIPRWKAIPLLPSSDLEFSSVQHIPKWLPKLPEERTYKKWESESKRVRGDLGLWENNCGGIGNISEYILIENKEKKKSDEDGDGDGDFVMERGRVRFKIGEVKNGGIVNGIRVYKRNWASKGGERVCC